MKTLKLTLAAFGAVFVSSTAVTTPVSAHSTNACVIDVYDFCGADHDCRISGALACQNHHQGGTPPPPPDPAYSATPQGGLSFSNNGLKLKAQ
jgi:hypothetical protein